MIIPAPLLYILSATVCLSVLYLFYMVLLPGSTALKARRGYVLLAIVISLLLPFSNLTVPQGLFTRTENAAAAANTDNKLPSDIPVTNTDTVSAVTAHWIAWAWAAYLLLTGCFFISFIFQCYKLLLCYRRAEKENSGSVTLVWNNRYKHSFSFFNLLFLNKAYVQPEDQDKIIAHESMHAVQYHSLDMVLMELLRVTMWFNPLVWKMRSDLQMVHEFLADEGVLKSGIASKVEYQQLLLNQVAEGQLFAVYSGLNTSRIKKRFLMMGNSKADPGVKFKLLALIPLTVVLLPAIGYVKAHIPHEPGKVIAAVEPAKMNVLYLGLDNPVNISVSGYTPEEITVEMDNGAVKGTNGKYIVRPFNFGEAAIRVYARRQIVSKTIFRVRALPAPVVALNSPGKIKGGNISKRDLLKAGGITAFTENADFDVSFSVASFSISITGPGAMGTNKQATTASGGYSREQRSLIDALVNGQQVTFDHIMINTPDGKKRKTRSTMTFTIADK